MQGRLNASCTPPTFLLNRNLILVMFYIYHLQNFGGSAPLFNFPSSSHTGSQWEHPQELTQHSSIWSCLRIVTSPTGIWQKAWTYYKRSLSKLVGLDCSMGSFWSARVLNYLARVGLRPFWPLLQHGSSGTFIRYSWITLECVAYPNNL